MAKILVLGGGFGGLVGAERLAAQLGDDHQITLVSRSRRFVFYPALVRLAFAKCKQEEVTFDLRNAMLDRRVNFIEAEVARIDPVERRVVIAHGDVQGQLPYDYLLFALGRRLATERVSGFYEHAHHLLDIDKALKFGKAIDNFHEGHAVIGQCAGARLPVPIYETAFALARKLEARRERERAKITVICPQTIDAELGDEIGGTLQRALEIRGIELLPNFPVRTVREGTVITADDRWLNFDLLMLLPPFKGSSAASNVGITNGEGYINVDTTMRVIDQDRIYAVGDCANFPGPKMGHMAVSQSEIAAANLTAEINGREPLEHYTHEVKLVVDDNADQSIFRHKNVVWPGINVGVVR